MAVGGVAEHRVAEAGGGGAQQPVPEEPGRGPAHEGPRPEGGEAAREGGEVPRIGPVVVDRERIRRRVTELAAEIERVYQGCERPLVLICVLKGSLLFTADLARALSMPVVLDFVACRSYAGAATSPGSVELVKDVSMPLSDRDVLMVEDIIDTGLTTSFLRQHLASHRPRSLRLAALLDKRDRRLRPVEIDFRGFEIPDRFVVGYGLDLDERYRNLPDVHVLEGV